MPNQDRIDTYEFPDGTQIPIRDDRVDNLKAEDVSYDNNDSGLQATDVQDAIDELNSEIDNISVDADQVDYDNSTSGLNATDVQAALDELAAGAGGATSADNVSYDNDDSGLAAEEVQSALDEVVSDMKGTSSNEALFHLGFYLDEHGGLCQVNSI
jgi:TolA-binding protein